MLYSFARVSAVIGMRRQDYFRQQRRGWLRLHEKGGTRHDVPAHHRAAEALDDYLALAGLDDAKAVASLAGLAPVTRQSGAWQGRSFIQGGRPRARRLLYMPALAAIRYNPDLRAKYRQLVAEGKPRKVAVVAVMRKLLVLGNALLEQDRCWLPERPGRDSAPFVAA